jgi:hypothetical protein
VHGDGRPVLRVRVAQSKSLADASSHRGPKAGTIDIDIELAKPLAS